LLEGVVTVVYSVILRLTFLAAVIVGIALLTRPSSHQEFVVWLLKLVDKPGPFLTIGAVIMWAAAFNPRFRVAAAIASFGTAQYCLLGLWMNAAMHLRDFKGLVAYLFGLALGIVGVIPLSFVMSTLNHYWANVSYMAIVGAESMIFVSIGFLIIHVEEKRQNRVAGLINGLPENEAKTLLQTAAKAGILGYSAIQRLREKTESSTR
jgi:hypothetical protein